MKPCVCIAGLPGGEVYASDLLRMLGIIVTFPTGEGDEWRSVTGAREDSSFMSGFVPGTEPRTVQQRQARFPLVDT